MNKGKRKELFMAKVYDALCFSSVIIKVALAIFIVTGLCSWHEEARYQEAMEEVSRLQKTGLVLIAKETETGKVDSVIYSDLMTMRPQVFSVSDYRGKLLTLRNVTFLVVFIIIIAFVWIQLLEISRLWVLKKSYGSIYRYDHEDEEEEI